MGQYYMAYVRDANGKERVFCPQNAVFMTTHGLETPDEVTQEMRRWDFDDPTSYGSLFSGLKLTEHSWLGNDFVSGVLETIWDNPCAVAWVGDYADRDTDFGGRYVRRVYEAVWGGDDGEGKLPGSPFDQVPTRHYDGFLVNVTKGVYVDLAEYRSRASFTPSWGNGWWCVHPLPLLTAVGNGRGGGDYHGTNMGSVGSWAMDVLAYTSVRPHSLFDREVDYDEITFVEGN